MKNLSVKELNYLNDMLSWELLSAKKSYQYAHQETDLAHRQIFFDAANAHQVNYNALLNYAYQINNEQGGQTH